MDFEQVPMQLILHGGNARGLAYEALDKAEEYNFEEADKLLQEANDEFLKGHKYQTQLIREQDKNMTPNFLTIHAQDHLMTAQAELQLIKRLVSNLKKQFELEKRINKLEN
ncbi:PTS lactose/cellobiose transporter subunit IIA [Bacillus sp. P2(2020)]|uniref:PTS lactose/cellobiose transporter subunit IIA n=2 Tax=Calidifontibacillus erzurumensis TaxID=2741433 RepID=A0A8J8KCQ2_9BACI|nr:PTS lactose/cellobiose transporter subunit IIA [Calidifontibacillus erzurumensis]